MCTSRHHPSLRAVADILEQEGVDLILSGMHHSYQRSKPLSFKPNAALIGAVKSYDIPVPGQFCLDQEFDGGRKTRPRGLLQIVTGNGVAGLLNPEQTDRPESWQPFTEKYIANVHGFTVVDVRGSSLEVKHISAEGKVLDRFAVT